MEKKDFDRIREIIKKAPEFDFFRVKITEAMIRHQGQTQREGHKKRL